jgi:hypothetical protein
MEMFRLALADWQAEQARQKAEAIRNLRTLQDHLEPGYKTIKPIHEIPSRSIVMIKDLVQAHVDFRTTVVRNSHSVAKFEDNRPFTQHHHPPNYKLNHAGCGSITVQRFPNGHRNKWRRRIYATKGP